MTDRNNTNKYLVYTRKSTNDSNNQKNSIDYQVGQCLKFAENNNLAIAQVDIDNLCSDGIIKERHSAYKTSGIKIKADGKVMYEIERPKFQQVTQLLLSKEFAGVIVLCWDRISRNEQDGIVVKDLIDRGIDIRFVQVTYDKTSSGSLHRDIDGMFATHYSRVISEKVCNTYDKLRKEGRCTYPAPIGYLDHGSDKKLPDPERAKKVKRIFELYATGEWSMSQLSLWANDKGLTTKPARPKRTQEEMLAGEENEKEPVCRPVTKKTIENILNNPFYVGKLKHKGTIIDGCHPPLIDLQLFQKVQKVLQSKNVHIHYQDKPFFALRRIIRCACGRLYSPYTKKGINYLSSKCHDSCGNTQKNITESLVENEIEQLLEKIHFSDEELLEIESKAKLGLDRISEKRNKELKDLESERRRIYADIDYLKKNKFTLLRTNASSPEEYAKEMMDLESQLADVDAKVLAYSEAESEMLRYVLTFSELIKSAKEYYKYALDVEKRDIVTQVFSELVFIDGKLHNVAAKEGFAALFARHEHRKNAIQMNSVLSGSEGGIRTHDQLVNSQLLCH
jgi:site-specific DNA recombinase